MGRLTLCALQHLAPWARSGLSAPRRAECLRPDDRTLSLGENGKGAAKRVHGSGALTFSQVDTAVDSGRAYEAVWIEPFEVSELFRSGSDGHLRIGRLCMTMTEV